MNKIKLAKPRAETVLFFHGSFSAIISDDNASSPQLELCPD